MDASLEQKMRRNITLYGPYQVFTKRVFLPLVSIYASQVAGLSISQIGFAAAAASVATILFETTTGFWADTYGRRAAARIGALLCAIGSVLFVVFPNLLGIISASVTLAMGYAFLNGSMAALIHDSLVVLNKVSDFPRIASRAQSLSLVVNAIIVAVAPMLYPIDSRLPFLVGALAYLVLLSLASLLTEPPVKHDESTEKLSFVKAVRLLVNRNTILFFIAAGFMYGVALSASDLFNLRFVELSIKPEHLGLIYAIGSLAGAALGLVIHNLRKLTFQQYASVDVLSNLAMFAAFAFINNPIIVIAAWIQNMALWRFQRIMYQHYVLNIFGNMRYKATLMSIISNISSIHVVWLVLVITGISNHFTIPIGMRYGALLILLFWPVLLLSISILAKIDKSSVPRSTQ